MRHVIDLAGCRALARDPVVGLQVEREADGVVERAQARAPKRTGAGAASIHAEKVVVNGVPEQHVSWDEEHDYMRFPEWGTEHMRAQPFLRPAARS